MKHLDEPEIEWVSLPGYDDIAEILTRNSHTGCTMVQRLTVKNFIGDEGFQSEVVIDLAHDIRDSEAVRVRFQGCHQIRIDDTYQVCGLAFRDISKRGWEFTKFEVYDYEESKIGLFCHRIRLERIDNTEQ